MEQNENFPLVEAKISSWEVAECSISAFLTGSENYVFKY